MNFVPTYVFLCLEPENDVHFCCIYHVNMLTLTKPNLNYLHLQPATYQGRIQDFWSGGTCSREVPMWPRGRLRAAVSGLQQYRDSGGCGIRRRAHLSSGGAPTQLRGMPTLLSWAASWLKGLLFSPEGRLFRQGGWLYSLKRKHPWKTTVFLRLSPAKAPSMLLLHCSCSKMTMAPLEGRHCFSIGKGTCPHCPPPLDQPLHTS